VRLRCVALRAVCAAAAMSVIGTQSKLTPPTF
jgi:hypothetical protein